MIIDNKIVVRGRETRMRSPTDSVACDGNIRCGTDAAGEDGAVFWDQVRAAGVNRRHDLQEAVFEPTYSS